MVAEVGEGFSAVVNGCPSAWRKMSDIIDRNYQRSVERIFFGHTKEKCPKNRVQ